MTGRIKPNTFKASLAVAAALISGLLLAAGTALADAGDLDRTFGKDGRVTTQLGDDDDVYALVSQPDGKVVAAGRSGGPYGASALVRYNRNGKLDKTFSGNGKVTPDFRGAASALVLQPDGKLVGAGNSRGQSTSFAVARFNPDGTPDMSFGEDGTATTDFSGLAHALVLQPDGKLVVAGSSSEDFTLARFDQDGTVDTSFGEDGKATTDFSGGESGGSDVAFTLALQPDGRLVAAGTQYTASGGENSALARYNPDGSPDTSFGKDGKVTTNFHSGGQDVVEALILQPDGKPVVAVGGVGLHNFLLARYNPDGTTDKTFGGDGTVTTNFRGYDFSYALALQPDGKLVAAGGSGEDFALARYNRNGTLDRSFGGDGKVTTDFGGSDSAAALALQPNGRLVAAGQTSDRASNSEFALARYATSGRREP